MSLEQVLEKLADALDRNTDASLKLLDAQFNGGKITTESEPIETTAGFDVDDDEPEKKVPAKKKATKKKAAPVDDKPEETEPETETASITMDDVRTAAMLVRDEVSKDALTAVKKAFKINGVKELGEENFAAFVRHCENVVARTEDV